jgi:regulatory protein
MFAEEFAKKKPKLSPKEALAKIQSYCAYQERSHKEVKNKLYEYGLYSSEVDELISTLIVDGFLNEERFAKAFAGGKFRIKKWGRLGLKEIDSSDYSKTLKSLINKKASLTAESNPFKKKNLIARYAIGKGYEAEIVWEMVKEEIS